MPSSLTPSPHEAAPQLQAAHLRAQAGIREKWCSTMPPGLAAIVFGWEPQSRAGRETPADQRNRRSVDLPYPSARSDLERPDHSQHGKVARIGRALRQVSNSPVQVCAQAHVRTHAETKSVAPTDLKKEPWHLPRRPGLSTGLPLAVLANTGRSCFALSAPSRGMSHYGTPTCPNLFCAVPNLCDSESSDPA